MDNLIFIATTSGVILVALLLIGTILSRLYHRATKEVSFVRTGMGGERVVKDGGCMVLPILQEVIPVNMNTLRLEVRRANEQALITRNRMRVDVTAEFYVRVAPTQDNISTAAQTLGKRTMAVDQLKSLIEGKFVDVLRAVAAEMAMEELHEKRADFVQRVQANVRADLEKNGLELETVSLTGLDQTDPKFFRVDNAFDAEGLTELTKITESKKKQRNDIERENAIQIQRRDLEAEQQSLQLQRESEYARLEQQREVEMRRAEQEADIAREQAERAREAQLAKIQAEQAVEEAKIAREKDIEAREIEKRSALEQATIEARRKLELAEQDKAIALASKSEQESAAQAKAATAEAESVRAAQQVLTVQQTAEAERIKQIALIRAREEAEKQAVTLQVAAEAEKMAAEDKAEAVRIGARAAAQKATIAATADAEAQKIKAAATAETYRVEAEGQRALNEASNTLSAQQVEMQLKQALYKVLPEVIRESAKPMEKIDGIKILQVDGLHANGAAHPDGVGQPQGVDAITQAALRYRSQAPLIDALLKEVGLEQGGSLSHLVKPSGNGADTKAPLGKSRQ